MNIVEDLTLIMAQAPVLPRRLLLDTPGVRATVPMIRGVWGAALRGLDLDAYKDVFQGSRDSGDKSPAYVLRPAPPDPEAAPAVEWVLIGSAICHNRPLMRAWDVASGMGLGPKRRRFHIRGVLPLDPWGRPGQPTLDPRPWPLSQAVDSLRGMGDGPCRLSFPAPLRILRNKRLVGEPGLPDIVVAICRRLESFLSEPPGRNLRSMRPDLVNLARRVPSTGWQGERVDLIRYSGSQKAEIELRGVAGSLSLPEGPGDLWPLFAAGVWLHLGKGTTNGLGRLVVEPIPA